MNKRICLAVLTLINFCAKAQDKGHYLVDFGQFTPPEKAIIESLVGHKAEPFLAKDIYGFEHFLPNYTNTVVVLSFLSIQDDHSLEWALSLNAIQQDIGAGVKVITFAHEEGDDVKEFAERHSLKFSIIPKGEIFGQMAYGGDLGVPRIFVINQEGLIQHVIPARMLEGKGIEEESLLLINKIKALKP